MPLKGVFIFTCPFIDMNFILPCFVLFIYPWVKFQLNNYTIFMLHHEFNNMILFSRQVQIAKRSQQIASMGSEFYYFHLGMLLFGNLLIFICVWYQKLVAVNFTVRSGDDQIFFDQIIHKLINPMNLSKIMSGVRPTFFLSMSKRNPF